MHYRGQESPILLFKRMILSKQIHNLVEKTISPDGLYVVDVSVSASNRINIIIDSIKGATIDDCVRVSRLVEGQLDRDTEDFELEVSSPGLTEPFRVPQQYQKNIGKEVEVILKSGLKQKGKLVSYSDDALAIETQKKVKPEGKKKPEIITELIKIELNDIKATKLILSF